MTGFWESDIGEVTGKEDDAFLRDFTIIPDGTMALAKIDRFYKAQDKQGLIPTFFAIDWTLTEGDFKGRKVTQKIKVLDNDAKTRHRALNMLKLLYLMFKIKPTSAGEPSDQELMSFVNKFAGLKIREWSMEKPDGSGWMEGNFISEVHSANGFKCETGIKIEVTHTNTHTQYKSPDVMDTAFSRNQNLPIKDLEDDIPFK